MTPASPPPAADPPSVVLAAVLVDELIRCGVTDFILSPGSRSAPLAYALQAAEAAGTVRLHVRIDERSAGFLAVGLAKVSGRPVPVVITSGSAAAHLHPAVLEADESGLPLVILTADRPPELRGTGASQTVDQLKLFGGAVRLFHEVGVPTGLESEPGYWRSLACRAVAVATGALPGRPGPVHLNLAFREPLVPTRPGAPPPPGRSRGEPWTRWPARSNPVGPVADGWPARTLVIAGDGSAEQGHAAVRLAEARGWPVVAEPSSGARTGPQALRLGHLLLGTDSWLADHLPERVLVVGRPTLHRQVASLLRRPDVDVAVTAGPAGWADATRTSAEVLADVPRQGDHHPVLDSTWLAAWQTADAAATEAVGRELAAGSHDPPSGQSIAAALMAALPPGSFLLAGSSMAVRDLTYAEPREGVTVHSSRGTAGIDGSVSTAVGSALAWQASGGGRAFALLGDLTFLHDQNGLILGPGELRPDLTIVLVNNDGGAIFSLLEQGSEPLAPAYERVFGTPHGVDLGAICGATALPYTRVSTLEGLTTAISDPRTEGVQVVEVRTPRTGDRALAARVRAAVASACANVERVGRREG